MVRIHALQASLGLLVLKLLSRRARLHGYARPGQTVRLAINRVLTEA
jgi:hypothetical protein